jgi:hypothetical protein
VDRRPAEKTCEVLHFAATPFVDRRLPLAAVVTLRGEMPQLVLAEQAPDWRCSGGWQGAALAQTALRALQHWDPASQGVPKGLEDILHREAPVPVPMGWRAEDLRNYIWGSPPEERVARGQHARTLGRAFFQARSVGQFVSENLDPNTYGTGQYRVAAAGVKVPLFVAGAKQLVLLEPVTTDSSAHKVSESIRRLAVWQRALQRHGAEWPPVKLIACLIARPDERDLSRIGNLEAVREFADTTFDTRSEIEAVALVQTVRQAALAA